MSYTRPTYNAADATWQGESTYTRPAFDAADASWTTGLQLTAPADASTQAQPITFSWEAYTGATAYQLQIATDAGFTSVVHDDATLTTTSKDVSGLPDATEHHWRVRPQTN